MTEHEKLHAIADKSQAIGEFIEWLHGQGIVMARYHRHETGCYVKDISTGRARARERCGLSENELYPENINITKLLAIYFQIDLKRLEGEKREILESLRKGETHARR
jgi:hypothetical protein